MKLNNTWLVAFTLITAILNQTTFAHGSDTGIDASTEDSNSAAIESDEALRPEQIQEKTRSCGPDSLNSDTLADYPKKPTPFFPGYTRVLADPHEALLAKIALIQAARKSIDISTYIFSPDLSSSAYVDELRQAVRRGVNVRFMVDAGGSMAFAFKDYYNHVRVLLYTEQQAADQASQNGGQQPGTVDVVIFRPLFRVDSITSTFRDRFLKGENLNTETSNNIDRRSHDKMLIIDKEDLDHTYAIVGGRNIDDAYYGVPQVDGDTYEDMELLVKNDAKSTGQFNLSNTLEHHFQDLLCAKGNRWLSTPRSGAGLIDAEEKDVGPELDGSLDKLLAKSDIQTYYNRIWGTPASTSHAMEYFEKGFIKSKISPANEEQNVLRAFSQVMVNPNETYIDKSNNGDSIYTKFLKIAEKAKKTIDICTPYIFLPPDERDCLKAWVMADQTRHLRLLSNSVATSDSAAAMETFDMETAPAMLKEGHYHCDLGTGKVYDGEFVNQDKNGKPLIEVLELGRLDNKMFAGNVIDGEPAEASAFYGKLHAKFAIVDGNESWVGSDNLDERSRHINSETAIFVDSSQIGSQLTAQFNGLAARSYHFGEKDWLTMTEQPQVKKRLDIMKALEKVSGIFPQIGFGN